MAELLKKLGYVPRLEGTFANQNAEIYAVGSVILPIIKDRLFKSKRLTQFLLWHDSLTVVNHNLHGNLWFGDYHPTPEDVLSFGFNSRFQKRARKQARAIERMHTLLDEHPEQENMMTIVIRKSDGLDFHILARAPKGKNIDDDLDIKKRTDDQTRQDIMYFRPEQACTSIACSDVFQANKINHHEAIVYVPYLTRWEAYQKLTANSSSSHIEYAPDGKTALSDILFITAGIVGTYSNETQRARVSDFWNWRKSRR